MLSGRAVRRLALAIALCSCSKPSKSPQPAFAPPPPASSSIDNASHPSEPTSSPPDRIDDATAVDRGRASEHELTNLPTAPPFCEKSACGPAPAYPSGQCPDGVHVDGNGPCVAYQDGRCGWTGTVCPGEDGRDGPCNAHECGAPPVHTRWLCPDGTHVGELGPCVRSKAGACGWAFRPCRGQGRSAAPAPQPAPAAAPAPKPPEFFSCDPLPIDRQLARWPVREICSPGSGPHPPPRERVKSLGDGTHIIKERRGCYRARYKPCYSK